MKDRSRSTSAVSLLLRSQGPNKVTTKELVASLTEVAQSLDAEDKKAYELGKASKAECKQTGKDLDMALKKGKRAFDMSSDDYTKTDAQVRALQASLAELKGQIQSSNQQLDSLQAQLKKLRSDKGLLKKGAASSLRQVEAVIAKTFLRESNEHHKGKTSVEKKLNSLEELSKSLSVSFLQTDSDEDQDTSSDENEQSVSSEEKTEDTSSDDKQEDTTEVKHEETDQQKENQEDSKKHGPVLVLKSDKQAVVAASQATQTGFNEEEKKLLELIEVERKKLQDLEDNLQDMQPAISNKLKQAMEIKRTQKAAQRGMERDKKLMDVETKKCSFIEKNIDMQREQRKKVSTDVKMASKVIETMDTFLFLSSDLEGLQKQAAPAPSFLQIGDQSKGSLAVHAVPAVESPLSFVQENEGMNLEEMVENYGTSITEGPFDGVTKMISGLIASLKAQANEEVNQHQFCQDSLGKNRRDRIAKKNNIDTLTSTIRWAEIATVRLNDDLKYLSSEIKRLGDVQSTEAKELDAETTRVKKELADHKLADEVVTKAVVILTQLCDLDGSSLAQQANTENSKSKVGSRFSQCKEAANLLKSASKELKQLDTDTKNGLTGFTALSNEIKGNAKSAQDSRKSEQTSTKAAKAQRASELATAKKDAKEAQKELTLIDQAKQELEHQCSHVETREEKMAKRQEQIDAMKEALNVLNGEGIPA